MESNKTLVSYAEQDNVSRAVLVWLNGYADKPARINYEYLGSDTVGLALSTIQGAYKTRRYVGGGYEAQYQFKVIYRLQPSTNDQRLSADEVLDALGDWASSEANKPDLGEGLRVRRVTNDSRSSLFARYENGDEDHQILMTITYEVI